jgi:hypothetical protein
VTPWIVAEASRHVANPSKGSTDAATAGVLGSQPEVASVRSRRRPLGREIAVLAFRISCAAIISVAIVGFGASASADAKIQDHDPWQGIEKDGRIPKIEKPDDLEHPERWRYVPEGRLRPGNLFQRFIVSSFITPFFFHDTDVGFGGGIAITDIDFRQQRRREFAGLFLSYTAEGQQSYSAAWRRWIHHREAEGGGIFQEERSFLNARAGYQKALTRRFYGFGAGTDESDETSYADQTAFGELGVDLALPDPGDDLVFSASLLGEWHSLGDGRVKGEPNTEDEFPGVFDRAEDHSLGWLRIGLRYDTRDSQLQPYRGFSVGANVESALLQTDWDLGAIFSATGIKIFPLPPLLHDGGDEQEENPPTDTLALQLRTSATAGDLPFFSMPMLGGSRTLRGFIAGRFRDRSSWHASAEYRFWVLPRGFPIPYVDTMRVERVGLALFADVGSVAHDWPGLFSSTVRASLGIGFRLTLERAAPFRIDVGFSDEGVEVTAGFGLSF